MGFGSHQPVVYVLVDSFPLVYDHQFHLFCYHSELHGAVDETEWQRLVLVCPIMDVKSDISLTVPVLVYGSRHP